MTTSRSGVLFECQRRHISVPEQMAIVGFNDLEFMASSVPTLTSVRTNRYEMGRNAATMVIETLDGRPPEQPHRRSWFHRHGAPKFGARELIGNRPGSSAQRDGSMRQR